MSNSRERPDRVRRLSDLARSVEDIEWRRHVRRGPSNSHDRYEPFEDPLEEIPRAINEFAAAKPSRTAVLQPQKWSLRDVFTGRTG
jgi:hypothetical protein